MRYDLFNLGFYAGGIITFFTSGGSSTIFILETTNTPLHAFNAIMQQLHVNTLPFSAFVKTEKGMSIFKNSYSIPLFIKGHVFFARQKRDKRKELVIRALIYQFTNSIFVHDSFRKISSNPNMTATYQCNKRKHAYLILHRIQ